MTKETRTHLIADPTLGGLQREYVETDRKADVGDYVVVQSCREIPEINGRIGKCTNNGEFSDGSIDVDIPSEQYGEFSFLDGVYDVSITLDPTDIVRVEGARYKLVDRKAEVGEKVVITKAYTAFEGNGEYRSGGVYTVTEAGDDAVYTNGKFLDGSQINLFRSTNEYHVLEPVDADDPTVEVNASQASPEVIEMLGNLALRITELERTNKRLLDEKLARIEDELDTLHANQKRMAEELENTKAQADNDTVVAELARLLARESRKVGR